MYGKQFSNFSFLRYPPSYAVGVGWLRYYSDGMRP